jgi:curved DNA-binding protein CbpA
MYYKYINKYKMSFNTLRFDGDNYKQTLFESTGPGRYQNVSQAGHLEGNATCFQEQPEFNAATGQFRISDNNDMSAIESDLFNLNRKATKDPRGQYPFVKPTYKQKPMIESCSRTALSKAYPSLDGNQFNRGKTTQKHVFQSVCLNPQKMNRIRSNNYIGMQTRLYLRDAHQPKVRTPMDQSNSFPQSGKFVSPMDQFLQNVNQSYPQQTKAVKSGKEGFCASSCMRR